MKLPAVSRIRAFLDPGGVLPCKLLAVYVCSPDSETPDLVHGMRVCRHTANGIRDRGDIFGPGSKNIRIRKRTAGDRPDRSADLVRGTRRERGGEDGGAPGAHRV